MLSRRIFAMLAFASMIIINERSGQGADQSWQNVLTEGSNAANVPKANLPLFNAQIIWPTSSFAEAVEIADVNSDGLNDVLLVTSFYFDELNDYRLFVFLQNAEHRLDPPVKYDTGQRLESIDVGDFNNDGKLDVAVCGQSLGIFFQNTSGTLDAVYPVPFGNDARFLKAGDFNNDGRQDLVTCDWGSDSVQVHLQTGSGTLNAPVSYNVTHDGYDELEVGDVNNDGLTDVIVMNGQGVPDVGVLVQETSGTLRAPTYCTLTANVRGQGAGVGDVNGDGRSDVVVSHGGNSPNGRIGVFLQNGAGSLNPSDIDYASYDIPSALEIADVDDDNRKDVITLHDGWGKIGVYRQNNAGSLNAEELFPCPAENFNTQALAVGDINSDGRPDIVTANYNTGLAILTRANGNANCDLKGEWVEPEDGGEALVRTCKTSGSKPACKLKGKYLISNDGDKPSGSFVVQFYLSDDVVLDNTDLLIAAKKVKTIKNGFSKQAAVKAKFAADVNLSGKYVISVIDRNFSVNETREWNNWGAFGPIL